MATGFAIRERGDIVVRTVSCTERAAKVNWLVVGCGCLVPAEASDQAISATFDRLSKSRDAVVVPVFIKENRRAA